MVQAVYRVDLHVGHAVGVHSVSETHDLMVDNLYMPPLTLY